MDCCNGLGGNKMSNKKNGISEIINHRNSLRFKLVGEATIIGALVGIVIVLNRILITKLSPLFKNLYSDASGSFLNVLKVLCVVTVVGIIVGEEGAYDIWKWDTTIRRCFREKNKDKLVEGISL